MTEYITPPNISFVVGIIGVIFGVYHYFKNPQIDQDKKQALFEHELMNMKDNVGSIEKKVDELVEIENEMNLHLSKEITRLATILDERQGRVG